MTTEKKDKLTWLPAYQMNLLPDYQKLIMLGVGTAIAPTCVSLAMPTLGALLNPSQPPELTRTLNRHALRVAQRAIPYSAFIALQIMVIEGSTSSLQLQQDNLAKSFGIGGAGAVLATPIFNLLNYREYNATRLLPSYQNWKRTYGESLSSLARYVLSNDAKALLYGLPAHLILGGLAAVVLTTGSTEVKSFLERSGVYKPGATVVSGVITGYCMEKLYKCSPVTIAVEACAPKETGTRIMTATAKDFPSRFFSPKFPRTPVGSAAALMAMTYLTLKENLDEGEQRNSPPQAFI